MDRVFPYACVVADTPDMDTDESSHSTESVLAVNLKALMAAHPELGSNPKLGKKTGLGASGISRLVNGHNASLKTVDALAEAFGLHAWQLLVPHLDPKNPPVVQPVSEKERALYERFKEVAKELAKET